MNPFCATFEINYLILHLTEKSDFLVTKTTLPEKTVLRVLYYR